MSTTFNNVFILGATSGLGAALARRYYEAGKKVMIAGRRQERLQAMQEEMPNLETIQVCIIDSFVDMETAFLQSVDRCRGSETFPGKDERSCYTFP